MDQVSVPCVYAQSSRCVWLFVTPWTVAHQASLFMEISRQEYWSGFPIPPPGDFPNPGIQPVSLKDCKMYLEQFFAQKDSKFGEDGIMKLPKKWQNVVEQNGEYFVE